MIVTGIFQCIKCNLVFTATSYVGQAPSFLDGWHLKCPNMCMNEIKYDNHSAYYTPHKLFKWLNYEVLFGKGEKNGKKVKFKHKKKDIRKR